MEFDLIIVHYGSAVEITHTHTHSHASLIGPPSCKKGAREKRKYMVLPDDAIACMAERENGGVQSLVRLGASLPYVHKHASRPGLAC